MPLTRKQIRDDILRSIGIEDIEHAPQHILESAATAVNRALQDLRLDPSFRFAGRVEHNVSIGAGSSSADLPDSLQTVETVRRAGAPPLRPVHSLSDILQYRRRFLGEATESPGTPQAYFVEMRLGSGAEAAAARIHIAPTPVVPTTLTVEGIAQAPRYSASQMADNSQSIPMPHEYIESLLLPLARHHMARSTWQRDQALIEALRADAMAAATTAGLALPWPDLAQQPATPK